MKTSYRFWIIVLALGMLASSIYSQDVDFQALDRYIDKAVEDFQLPGLAISVIKDGSVVFSRGYGYKNFETKEPMTTTALFNIASCSKAFTAACLGILVKEGKLDWQDKVIDIIPELQLADPCITKALNIRDILSHRSGLATFVGDLLWYETDYDNREIIHRMRYLPIQNDFRSQFGYQNNMFMIAGEIVKQITGKMWSEFLVERLFLPLEMTESRSCSKHITAGQDIAMPHFDRKPQPLAIYEPNPAGSIYSCVDEMSHWIRALLDGGNWNDRHILDQEIIETLFTPHTILPVSQQMKENGIHFHAYGLGWFLFDYAGKKIVEHDGGMPGYISKVTLVPEKNLGFVILTNDMNNLTGALRYRILDTFLAVPEKDWAAEYLKTRQEYEQAREKRKSDRYAKRIKNTKPSLDLMAYTGVYTDKAYGNAQIELENEHLKLTLLPTKEKFVSRMEHWHFNTFRIKFKDEFLPEGFVTFRLNTDAEITGFTIDLPNPDFHFFNLDFKKME
jgi:CubicO group peptidase (beta-lactamase class C family)